MKRLLFIPAGILVASFASCNGGYNKTEQPMPEVARPHWDTAHFPRVDTISIGLKSDGGHYALMKYYIERLSRDNYVLAGAENVKLSDENWHVVSRGETAP
jgi:hypothetical protein